MNIGHYWTVWTWWDLIVSRTWNGDGQRRSGAKVKIEKKNTQLSNWDGRRESPSGLQKVCVEMHKYKKYAAKRKLVCLYWLIDDRSWLWWIIMHSTICPLSPSCRCPRPSPFFSSIVSHWNINLKIRSPRHCHLSLSRSLSPSPAHKPNWLSQFACHYVGRPFPQPPPQLWLTCTQPSRTVIPLYWIFVFYNFLISNTSVLICEVSAFRSQFLHDRSAL